MTVKIKNVTILLIVFVCLVLAVAKFVPVYQHKLNGNVVWSEDFSAALGENGTGIPKNWKLQKKPGTPPAVFSLDKDVKNNSAHLRMEADKASGSLITRIDNVDIEKTPLLKWRWKVETLPAGADGRYKEKDDQAIGIYVGTGSLLNNKCVSYRWDTDTPKGDEGNCVYGAGAVKVKWFTLRNKKDLKQGGWLTEERNVAEDFKKAWGFYPETIYLSVSCNSQYTGTKAAAELERIEFFSSASRGGPQGEIKK